MGEWRKGTIRDIAAPRGLVGGPFGSSLVSRDYTDFGVPVIRGANLGRGRFVDGDFVYVAPEKARDLRGNQACRNDLVFTQRGTLGQVALVPLDGPEAYVVSQSQMRLRVEPTVADARFILYACMADDFIRQVHENAIATGVPHINLGILSRLEVPLPPVDEQRAIAEVLGALDDKIVANARVVRGANALSAASYSSMLVEGPDAPLTSLADFINGKAFTKGASGTGRVVIRIAELNSGVGGSTVYSDAEVDDRHVARPGDILFAWSGSLTLHRWFRPEGIINQHIFKVIPKSDTPKWLVWHAVADRLEYFKAVAADKATTMGHIQRRHLDETVTVPAPETVASRDRFMTDLWDRALAAEEESLRLVATRDALLPALMSGALRVKDAERLAEDLT